MKLGIIGLPQSGKRTVFEALTGMQLTPGQRGETNIGTIDVPDERVDALSRLYKPRKTTYARVEYLLPGAAGGSAKQADGGMWNQVRTCDALIHVVRNFSSGGFGTPTPLDDFRKLDGELIFADLVSVTRRIERLETDRSRGRKFDARELELLQACLKLLESDRPLREDAELARAPILRGFTFLSGKPVLTLFNNDDEDDRLPLDDDQLPGETCMTIRGRLEAELSSMSTEEAREFLTEFDIPSSALDRVVRASYNVLGLISFFTVGPDEVRAWEIRRGTPAVEAAGEIHTDIQKGFIRAEVVSYNELMAAGSHAEARKRGVVRLEGKDYPVADGDVIDFRFSV